jgi:hypothetical protein
MAAAALTSVVPGCATTQEPSGMFPVDFGTRIAWNGKDRIIGEIHNNSGHAARHLRLVTDGLNSKGYVISRAYHSVDATIPAGGQAHFEAEVPSAPSYRVRVDQVEAARAP